MTIIYIQWFRKIKYTYTERGKCGKNVNSWGMGGGGVSLNYSFTLAAGLKFFTMKSWRRRKAIHTNNI